MDLLSGGIVGELVSLTGENEEVVRMYLCLLACLPIAIFHRMFLLMRSPAVQHAYFFATGFSLLVFWLGWEVAHIVVPSVLTYALLCIFSPSPLLCGVVFVGTLGHLVYGFLSDGAQSYRLGWMAPGCINTQALFAFAMDVADGRKPEDKRSTDQKKLALAKVPSLLAFLGFKFNPVASLIGPMINFRTYEQFVVGSHLNGFDHAKYSLTGRSIVAALVCLLESVASLGIMFFGDSLLPKSFFLADEFMEYSFVSRVFLLAASFFCNFGKYLSVWKLLEAASCICTLGYSGTDEEGPTFETCRQVHIWKLISARQLAIFSTYFNCATHHFTKRYIFKRLAFLGSKQLSMLISILYLAIWHGIHFGYFWTFAMCEFVLMWAEIQFAPVLQNLTGIYDVSKLPWYLRAPLHLLCLCYVYCGLGYGYLGMTYLHRAEIFTVASRVFFYQHVVLIPIIAICPFLPASWKARPVPGKTKSD